MSENAPIGLSVAEKVLGLILIIIGAIVVFYSSNPPVGDISQFSGIFSAISFVILGVGILLIIAKTE
jgi:hypothetical protein